MRQPGIANWITEMFRKLHEQETTFITVIRRVTWRASGSLLHEN